MEVRHCDLARSTMPEDSQEKGWGGTVSLCLGVTNRQGAWGYQQSRG